MYRPEIIAPSTAHPAVDKAAELFGMTVRRIPVREDDRVHAAAVKRAIGPHTCMVSKEDFSCYWSSSSVLFTAKVKRYVGRM